MNAILASNLNSLPSALMDRTALRSAVEAVSNVIEKRCTMPILTHARLTGDGNVLFVTGHDLDIEVVVAIPGPADPTLDMALPATVMKDLLKRAPDADMVAITQPDASLIDADDATAGRVFDGVAHVEFDTVDYRLTPLHPDAFPQLVEREFSHAFSMPGADFLAGLNGVSFAISTEETRYYLNGACLSYIEGSDQIAFTATDGHRLCKKTFDAPDGAAGLPSGILPRKLVATLEKLMKGKACPETVSVQIADNRVRVQFDNVTVTSKLVEGSFPDTDRVTPRHNDKRMTVSITALQDAIKAVTVLDTKRITAVKMDASEAGLTLSARDGNSGSMAVTTIDAEIGFEAMEIGFNARYVSDFLANLKGDCETITFDINDAGSPALVTAGREDWLGVLMPMRV